MLPQSFGANEMELVVKEICAAEFLDNSDDK
jgi:hypothetical protein